MKLELFQMQQTKTQTENKELKEKTEQFTKTVTMMEKKLGLTEQKLE